MRNFTLLVVSSSDFVSANVILNQHLDISLRHGQNLTCVPGFEYVPGLDC